MEHRLTDEIRRYLDLLLPLQQELTDFFAAKRNALAAAEPERLLPLNDTEAELASRFRSLLGQRGRILHSAAQAGFPSDSLQNLTARLEPADATGLQQQISRARAAAVRLRTESWTQWIIAERSARHYGEILDLIALGGRRSPIYDAQKSGTVPGGAILDASA